MVNSLIRFAAASLLFVLLSCTNTSDTDADTEAALIVSMEWFRIDLGVLPTGVDSLCITVSSPSPDFPDTQSYAFSFDDHGGILNTVPLGIALDVTVRAIGTAGELRYVGTCHSALTIPETPIDIQLYEQPPRAPHACAVTVSADSLVVLSWTDRSSEEVRQLVERKHGGTFIAIDTVEDDVETYCDSGMVFGDSASYRIRAVIAEGLTSLSDTAVLVSNSWPWPNRAPTIAAIGNQSLVPGELLQRASEAVDPDGDALSYTVHTSPAAAGATVDTNGTVSWQTKDTTTEKAYLFTLFVSDGEYSDSVSFTVTVSASNHSPLIDTELLDSITALQYNEGETISFRALASDLDGDTLHWILAGGPTGSALNTDSGTFTWPVGYDMAGTHPFSISVNDGIGTDIALCTLTIDNVNRAPVFRNSGNKAVACDSTLSFSVIADDADNDGLSYAAVHLPLNAHFIASAETFSWTAPSAAGRDTAIFSVTDAGSFDYDTVIIIVGGSNRAPAISAPDSSLAVNEGDSIVFSLSATDPDGTAGLVFSMSPAPAAGATLDSTTGTFRWQTGFSDSTSGKTVRFTVSDGTLESFVDIVFTVANVDRAPLASAVKDTFVAEGTELRLDFATTDPDGGALTYAVLGQPCPGDTNNWAISTAGLFSWTPDFARAGRDTLIVQQSCGGLSAKDTLVIRVTNTNRPPVFVSVTDQVATEGSPFNFTFKAQDPDSELVHYELDSSWGDMGINAALGTFHWTPDFTDAGVKTLTIRAFDAEDTIRMNVTITVSDGTCAAPTGLHTVPGDGTLDVTWDPVAGATSYTLYYIQGDTAYPGQSLLVSVPDLTVASSTLSNLPNNLPYALVVTAFNGAGESAPSAMVRGYAEGLIARYEFSGNASCTGRAIFDGVAQNAPSWGVDRFGTANACLDGNHAENLNGPFQHITVPNSRAFDFDRRDFTMTWWEKRDAVSNWVFALARDKEDVSPWLLGMIRTGADSQHVSLSSTHSSWDLAYEAGGGVPCVLQARVDARQWNHFALVRDDTVLSFYRNGELSAQYDNFTGTLDRGVGDITIGTACQNRDGSDIGIPFRGSLDDVRFYNVGTTATGIFDIYHDGGYDKPDAPANLSVFPGDSCLYASWSPSARADWYTVITSDHNDTIVRDTCVKLHYPNNSFGRTVLVQAWNGAGSNANSVGPVYPMGPELRLPFDGGDVSDSSGHQHSVTVHGPSYQPAITADRFGKADGALLFDGSSDFCDVADHAAWDFMANDFTIQYWEKRDTTEHWSSVMARDSSSGASSPWRVGWTGEAYVTGSPQSQIIGFQGSSDGVTLDMPGPANPPGNGNGWGLYMGIGPVGVWNLVTITRRNNVLYSYCNDSMLVHMGNGVAPFATTLAFKDVSSPLLIGTSEGYVRHFKGALDDIRIYNRGMCDVEVKERFLATP